MSRMHEATEQILQAEHPDAWTEVIELRAALTIAEKAMTAHNANRKTMNTGCPFDFGDGFDGGSLEIVRTALANLNKPVSGE